MKHPEILYYHCSLFSEDQQKNVKYYGKRDIISMQSPLPWPRFCLLHIHGMCHVCQIFTLLSGIGPHQLLQMPCTFSYHGEKMKAVLC